MPCIWCNQDSEHLFELQVMIGGKAKIYSVCSYCLSKIRPLLIPYNTPETPCYFRISSQEEDSKPEIHDYLDLQEVITAEKKVGFNSIIRYGCRLGKGESNKREFESISGLQDFIRSNVNPCNIIWQATPEFLEKK